MDLSACGVHSSSCYVRTTSALLNCIESLPLIFTDNFIITGDINIPELSHHYGQSCMNSMVADFTDFTNFIHANRHNHVLNSNARILDVVLASVDCTVTHDPVPLITEDLHHPALSIDLSLQSSTKSLSVSDNITYDFKNADYLLLYRSLESTDWSILNDCNDIKAAFTKFYDIVTNIFNACVPTKKIVKSKYPPWFSKNIINALKAKDRNRRLFKRFGIEPCKHDYLKLRAKIKKTLK